MKPEVEDDCFDAGASFGFAYLEMVPFRASESENGIAEELVGRPKTGGSSRVLGRFLDDKRPERLRCGDRPAGVERGADRVFFVMCLAAGDLGVNIDRGRGLAVWEVIGVENP